MKLQAHDTVLVIAGKYKGKTGKILKTYKKTSKVTVEKINIRTKHIKKSQGRKGERIQYEAPFNASNVKLICPNCSKVSRIGYIKAENKKKQRICKKCQQPLMSEKKTIRTKKKK